MSALRLGSIGRNVDLCIGALLPGLTERIESMSDTPLTPLVIWRNTQTRTRIIVYPDFKRRLLYGHVSNRYADSDEWPVLWRSEVPNLTDAEWIAAPFGDEWEKEV